MGQMIVHDNLCAQKTAITVETESKTVLFTHKIEGVRTKGTEE